MGHGLRQFRMLLAIFAGLVLPLPSVAEGIAPRGAPATLSGTVIDAFRDEFDANFHFLVIQNESGTHYATSSSPDIDQNYVNGLVGADVTISGVKDPASPPTRRYLGPAVFFSGPNNVKVLKPPA